MSDGAFAISLLSQGVGYGVVVGLGVLFAVVILLAVKFQKEYLGEDSEKSEMFMCFLGAKFETLKDTAFWQKSFAAEVNATVPGYNLAALAIFAVPWAMGTVMGLTARAFQHTAVYPFLPDGFSSAQVNAGYVMPYTIHALLGAGGSAGMLLLLFMAVTSTVSSSMVAVSSILAYDVYRTYVNPRATDRQTVTASHLGVLVHGVVITGVTLALNYAGADINWLSYTTNMIKCPGICPLILTLIWSRQSKAAAVAAPIGGMACGLAVWFATTWKIYGVINMTTTAQAEPCLYGALTATFAPALFSVLISYLGPKEIFDWNEFLRIELVKDNEKGTAKDVLSPSSGSGTSTPGSGPGPVAKDESGINIQPAAEDTDTEKARSPPDVASSSSSSNELVHPFDAETLASLYRWYKIAWAFLAFIVTITFVAWPLPLYRDYIFPPKFFGGWVTMSIVWQFFALGAVVVYPIYDGWGEISKVARGLWGRYVKKGGVRAPAAR
ncbi:hypothetical protein SLS62_001933 [Diatrype stigma]|uniref:Uncharacterized protein n=1 Tax=Diatrype stigma TaxID=117547 RepID=A0AAN9YSW0_9PEZI